MKATEYDASANNHLEVKSKNAVSSGSPFFHSYNCNTTVCTKNTILNLFHVEQDIFIMLVCKQTNQKHNSRKKVV